MAKQHGIHQLRGKVDGMSYYRQTGVQSGLVRTINTGLSNRVKTADEFANTRRNNDEFGQACRIASVYAKFITPKFRPMILSFSQSKLSKAILEEIKLATGNWGQRNFTDAKGEKIAAFLSALSKNDFSEFGVSFSFPDGGERSIIIDENADNKLAAIGADGMDINMILGNAWIGTYSRDSHKYAPSYARAHLESTNYTINEGGSSVVIEESFPAQPPQGWPATDNHVIVFVIMPYRLVNNAKHILQEHCAFGAFADVEES